MTPKTLAISVASLRDRLYLPFSSFKSFLNELRLSQLMLPCVDNWASCNLLELESFKRKVVGNGKSQRVDVTGLGSVIASYTSLAYFGTRLYLLAWVYTRGIQKAVENYGVNEERRGYLKKKK